MTMGHPSAPTWVDTSPAAIEARREWWQAGAVGHWPGCPCGKHPSHPGVTVDIDVKGDRL